MAQKLKFLQLVRVILLAVFGLELLLLSPLAVLASDPDTFTLRARKSVQNKVDIGPGDKKLGISGAASVLEPTDVFLNTSGDVILSSLPSFRSYYGDHFASRSSNNHVILYTLDPDLQQYVIEIVKKVTAPHVAIVAIEPETGKILALADKSNTIKNLAFHSRFPAASLFKVVTSAAVIEKSGLQPQTEVSFRGGTYELERWNYLPDPRRDRRQMSLSEALGRSCNAVFGRLGMLYLNSPLLKHYATSFGFNSPIKFERSLPVSEAVIPGDDSYALSRTAAGFGDVTISPVHAAAMMAGIANRGVMQRPYLVDRVFGASGKLLYEGKPQALRRMMTSRTAGILLEMMEDTTTLGTSRRDFMVQNRSVLGVPVAAKTGTLSGTNPKGLNHWFIAAAPATNPKIAIAVIVVNSRSAASRAGRLGRLVLEKYLYRNNPQFEPPPGQYAKGQKMASKKPKKRYVKSSYSRSYSPKKTTGKNAKATQR